ncbi:MAG: N-6 DNA methylase [Flavobacteriia bacterium]|nr:N-6 DNA methylase [Flavobacteriia bacterium]
MALFQQSVITKHINSLDKNNLEQKWNDFSIIFHNKEKQTNIRNSKEEQYQEGFLRELFVNVLGYTINPDVNFNLLTEQKNQNNSKKADGAILIDGKIKVVIELKGTDTSDLNRIENQAFAYKNNQPECVYVITSNFEKIRFYIENAVDFIEFNLFKLQREEFDLLYCCLAYENIKGNIPKHLKDESVSKENQITKKLYKDYSDFKKALYNNLIEKNPEKDKLLLFKKTQKLLDRFLFIFFAEDRQLVPTNLIRRINLEWENLKKARIPVSLYDRYKMYFEDLNIGATVTLPAFGKKTGDAITAEFEIFAYNGGLFQPDEVLDNVVIDDDILHKHSIILSDYDFESDVDVNILGHIFENSLNEIDEIKSEIEGNTIDKTKTKRKKDGVFYTPKYITKYIVESTIGKLCEEKKAELEIIDEEFAKGRKNRNKTTIQKLDKSLQDYREWLLQITICDPACGSGAFLNQALEFLIQEHKQIDDLQSQLFGTTIGFPGAELHILENNIYGVDLNDESVEIAKLSLWLRTAQKGRKLNSLNNNIKCGNSLIDDPAVAGDKAFSWEKEFPEIFKEKNKFAYHITTCLHDSRTSNRMITYKARERRFGGTKPEAEVFPMTKEEEELIAQTVAEIVKEDNLNIAAFNLCWDHMHILLVCEEEEVPKIMQKIKGRTARIINSVKGINPLGSTTVLKDGSTPFWTQKYYCKPITSDDQFWNTFNYIEDNKVKHKLPSNPKLKGIINTFIKTREECLKTQFKGGFDVIIGNPPYVDIKGLDNNLVRELFAKYTTAENRINLYSIFIEKGYQITKNNGILSFINPNSILINSSYTKIRKMLISDMTKIIKLPDDVFEDATVETIIFQFQKKLNCPTLEAIVYPKSEKITFVDNSRISIFDKSSWSKSDDCNFNIFISVSQQKVLSKIEKNNKRLSDYADFCLGITPYDKYKGHSEETIKNREFHADIKIDDTYKPLITGENITRYQVTNEIKEFIKYGDWLGAARNERFFKNERIIVRQIVSGNPPRIYAGYTNEALYFTQIGFGIITKELKTKFLLCLLNSKLLNFYHKFRFIDLEKELFQKILIANCKNLPIKYNKTTNQIPFIEKADLMLTLNKDLQSISQKFSKYFSSQYNIEKLSGKLEKWYELEFTDFIKELNKSIKTVGGAALTKKDEFEWMDLFEENKKKALDLKAEIDKADKEIDQMVYKLYELTEEEIKIVEGE